MTAPRLLAAVVALLTAASAGTAAHAHSVPDRRSIVVQVEDDQILLLVTWTAPTGVLGQLMMARGALLAPGDPRRGFRELMARRAMAGVEMRFRGAPLPVSELRSKLTLDASSLGRHSVTVLVTLPLADGPGALELRLPPSASESRRTRSAWVSRAEARRVVASRDSTIWAAGGLRLSLQAVSARPR